MAICWSLWLERNSRIFEDKESSLEFIWERVKFWVALWVFETKEFKDFLFSDLIRDWSLWM